MLVGKRTKIVGGLLIAVAVLNAAADVLNGGGFSLKTHLDSLVVGLNGTGLITFRLAVEALLKALSK